MSDVPTFASRHEALGMLHASLRFLAADPAEMAVEAQAECLRGLEAADAMSTAVRAAILGAFTASQGHCEDADYSPAAWLMHRTRVSRYVARAHVGWARRAAAHPLVAAAMADGGVVSESYGRAICGWTDRLPQECRAAADAILVTAARAGMELPDLAELAAEIYARSLPGCGDGDDDGFEDRSVRLETTFEGAGVLGGDLTPECAAVVGAVLDALAAPAGAEDTRTHEQRYHDALAEAMRRLIAAGLLPERAGQPVKAVMHVSLAELRGWDGDSLLEGEWVAGVQARWAGYRAGASAGGSDGGAWLTGDAARALTCDARMATFVDGNVDLGALEDLVRLCASLDRLDHLHRPQGPCEPVAAARSSGEPVPSGALGPSGGPVPTGGPVPAGCCPGGRCRWRLSARPWTWSPGRAGWRRSCGPGSWARRWAGRACRWISGSATPSRPPSATPSPGGTGTAGGPAGAASPRRPARCTIRRTKPTAARPAPKTASCSARTTTRW